ncbi:hypothetical protein N7510_010459 [Penicillium lagena]|uniref:uncharacterized protein n=1 Tax=Penicillium lagena TaxID=94218 RepID=UPI002541AC40|nr:uncharacterized protein N7510_010459 [Penicillium lagena]KAJ5605305.1 hypothetical protein N7510_010459 [Penicillium lagena]
MAFALKSQILVADPAWHRRHDHAYYDKSHYRLQKFVREYAFRRHASLGFLAVSAFPIHKEYVSGMTLPAGSSVDEWDEFHDAIIIDEMTRCACLGIIWGINGGATVGGPPIDRYGTASQKEKYLAPLLRGQQRHCLCVTEPSIGSDVAGLTTEAKKTADGKSYTINGKKKWVTQGRWADHALVAARTGPRGAKGISIFIVPLAVKGISGGKIENRGSVQAFDDVLVPAENLLGNEDQGFEIIMSTFAHERLWVGITALRLGRVAYEDSYRNALKRETFGKQLFENQVIRCKFSRMANMLEPTQAYMEEMVYRSVRMTSLNFSPLAAMLKVQAAHNLEKISSEAQQVFGGLGYSRRGQGQRVEQIRRDVRVLVGSGGSEEILLDMIAKQQRKLAHL